MGRTFGPHYPRGRRASGSTRLGRLHSFGSTEQSCSVPPYKPVRVSPFIFDGGWLIRERERRLRRMPRQEHPVERFRRRLVALDPDCYPRGVVPIDEFIPGTAAFPGGTGLVADGDSEELPAFPMGGVMLIGHNFDSLDSHTKRLKSGPIHVGAEAKLPYWRNLYRLLDAADIPRRRCFFTNAYVGLSAENLPGAFPGERDASFRAWCRDFLADQIAVMQPTIIVAVGAPAARFLGHMSPELAHWRRSPMPPPQLRRATIAGHPTTATMLFHPSAQNRPAYKRRAYRRRVGFEAEVRLLTDAAARTG